MTAASAADNVLHVGGALGHAGMGISTAALGLARAQHVSGFGVEIWACDDQEAAAKVRLEFDLPENSMKTFPCIGPARLCFSPEMLLAAHRRHRHGVVHQHGIWQATSLTVKYLGARRNLPVVLAPHGSLEPYALGISPLRKSIASALYESRNLRNVACLHALTEREVSSFRNYGLKAPAAIIPNGISIDWIDGVGDASRFRSRYPGTANRRIILFLGRIAPIKGLSRFVRAFAAQKAKFDDWLVMIAGTDESGHKKEVAELCESLSVSESICFLGPLYGQEKRDAFEAAELFILPSLSEAFPMAALEALGAGIPVLTTRAVPLEDVFRTNCGWRVDSCESAIAEALTEVARLNRDQLRACGERGRIYVSRRYSWALAASKSIQLYRWLQGAGDRPDFVVMD